MTKLSKPNIDLLGNLRQHYLEDLGLPDDFIVVKEDRDTFTKRTLEQCIRKQTERGFPTQGINYDRIAIIWDGYEKPEHMIRCALDEAEKAYPKKKFYNEGRTYKTFSDYYEVVKIGPLTYHCYLKPVQETK